MKSKRLTVLVLLSFLAAALIARSHAQSVARNAAASASRQNGDASLILAGTIVQPITTPIASRDWSLDVPLNTWVRRGEVIGTAEAQTASREVDYARQELEQATLAEQRAQERVQQVEKELGAIQNQVRDLSDQESRAETAELEAERQLEQRDTQLRSGLTPWFNYSAAVAARDSSDGAIESIRSNLAAARFETNVSEDKAQEAQAELRDATARRNAAEAVLNQMQGQPTDELIVAPADGIVVAGQPDGTGYGIFSDPQHLLAYAMIPQADLMAVRVGQQSLIVLDAQPTVTFHAKVTSISTTPVDPEGAYFQVTFAFDNPTGTWLSGEGMHARLTPIAQK